jgi:hypothetical protein
MKASRIRTRLHYFWLRLLYRTRIFRWRRCLRAAVLIGVFVALLLFLTNPELHFDLWHLDWQGVGAIMSAASAVAAYSAAKVALDIEARQEQRQLTANARRVYALIDALDNEANRLSTHIREIWTSLRKADQPGGDQQIVTLQSILKRLELPLLQTNLEAVLAFDEGMGRASALLLARLSNLQSVDVAALISYDGREMALSTIHDYSEKLMGAYVGLFAELEEARMYRKHPEFRPKDSDPAD